MNVSGSEVERQLDEPPPGRVLGLAPGGVAARLDAPLTGHELADLGHGAEQPGADGGQRGRAGGESRRPGRARPGRRSRRPAAGAAPARWSARRRRAAPPPAPTRASPRSRRRRARRSPRARRATCSRFVPAVRPAIVPRASGRHHGAPTPVMPGRIRTPPELSAPRASAPSAGRLVGEAELAAHPLEHLRRREHAAVERVLLVAVDPPGDGRQQAARRLRHLVADVGEHEHAGPVGGLHAPGDHAAGAGERGLLVDHAGGQRQVAGQRSWRSTPSSPTLSPTSASASVGTPKLLAQPRVPALVAEPVELCARRGRGVGGEAGAEPVGEPRVDVAEPQRRAPAPRRSAAARPACRRRSTGRAGGRCGRGSRPRRARRAARSGACPARRRPGRAAGRSRRPTPAPTRPGGRARSRDLARRVRRAARRPRRRSTRGSPRGPARPSRGGDGATACAGAPPSGAAPRRRGRP